MIYSWNSHWTNQCQIHPRYLTLGCCLLGSDGWNSNGGCWCSNCPCCSNRLLSDLLLFASLLFWMWFRICRAMLLMFIFPISTTPDRCISWTRHNVSVMSIWAPCYFQFASITDYCMTLGIHIQRLLFQREEWRLKALSVVAQKFLPFTVLFSVFTLWSSRTLRTMEVDDDKKTDTNKNDASNKAIATTEKNMPRLVSTAFLFY